LFCIVIYPYANIDDLINYVTFVLRILENSQMPYSATVVINDIRYGTGYATSKKMAKLEAGMMVISLFSLAVPTFSISCVWLE